MQVSVARVPLLPRGPVARLVCRRTKSPRKGTHVCHITSNNSTAPASTDKPFCRVSLCACQFHLPIPEGLAESQQDRDGDSNTPPPFSILPNLRATKARQSRAKLTPPQTPKGKAGSAAAAAAAAAVRNGGADGGAGGEAAAADGGCGVGVSSKGVREGGVLTFDVEMKEGEYYCPLLADHVPASQTTELKCGHRYSNL